MHRECLLQVSVGGNGNWRKPASGPKRGIPYRNIGTHSSPLHAEYETVAVRVRSIVARTGQAEPIKRN